MFLRGLVGVTCIAIIAAIGAYFWDRQQARIEAAQAKVEATRRALDETCYPALARVQQGGDFYEARRILDRCEAIGWKAPE
ncbi:hypothetical protein [Jiella sp. M17.18]|uniref:hypothetical protein n=1 Tax=Jiella sp. M17.18 TaxID=3234247 RepID=UPI0034DE6A98